MGKRALEAMSFADQRMHIRNGLIIDGQDVAPESLRGGELSVRSLLECTLTFSHRQGEIAA